MANFNLRSFEDATVLVNLCNKYKNVDVTYGRYTIDGCSYLAVASLIGKIVGVQIITEDKEVESAFEAELVQLQVY